MELNESRQATVCSLPALLPPAAATFPRARKSGTAKASRRRRHLCTLQTKRDSLCGELNALLDGALELARQLRQPSTLGSAHRPCGAASTRHEVSAAKYPCSFRRRRPCSGHDVLASRLPARGDARQPSVPRSAAAEPLFCWAPCGKRCGKRCDDSRPHQGATAPPRPCGLGGPCSRGSGARCGSEK